VRQLFFRSIFRCLASSHKNLRVDCRFAGEAFGVRKQAAAFCGSLIAQRRSANSAAPQLRPQCPFAMQAPRPERIATNGWTAASFSPRGLRRTSRGWRLPG